MSNRIVSDTTGLYKLNIVSKDKSKGTLEDGGSRMVGRSNSPHRELPSSPVSRGSPRAVLHPMSPRRAGLKIISNEKTTGEQTDKEILTKIAQVEEEILQCQSSLSSLNDELKGLQMKLRPAINQSVSEDMNDGGSSRNSSPVRLASNSTGSTWKLFKENGTSLLKKFKDFTINDEEEQEYDDYLIQNKNNGIHHFTVKDGLNYQYDTESDDDTS